MISCCVGDTDQIKITTFVRNCHCVLSTSLNTSIHTLRVIEQKKTRNNNNNNTQSQKFIFSTKKKFCNGSLC